MAIDLASRRPNVQIFCEKMAFGNGVRVQFKRLIRVELMRFDSR
jgi:hypothetical protein